MYAVVRSGGNQYKVSEGDVIRVERLEGEVGSSVALGEVLLVGEGETVTVGRPLVAAAQVKVGAPLLKGGKVEAKVVSQGREDKIIIIKFRRRKHYRRTQGHRQDYTALKIQAIKAS